MTTTDFFWDCECKDNYVHPFDHDFCIDCYAVSRDRPQSRVNEVNDDDLANMLMYLQDEALKLQQEAKRRTK